MEHMADVGFGVTLLWFTVHNIIFIKLADGTPEPSASAAASAGAPVSLPGTLLFDDRCKRFALHEEPRESAAGSTPVAVHLRM